MLDSDVRVGNKVRIVAFVSKKMVVSFVHCKDKLWGTVVLCSHPVTDKGVTHSLYEPLLGGGAPAKKR